MIGRSSGFLWRLCWIETLHPCYDGAKYNAEWVDDKISAQVTKFELAGAKAALAREQFRISQQAVTAASSGTFNTI